MYRYCMLFVYHSSHRFAHYVFTSLLYMFIVYHTQFTSIYFILSYCIANTTITTHAPASYTICSIVPVVQSLNTIFHLMQ